MARLETLPSELILLIAEACTLGPYPRRPRLFGPGGNYHQRPKKSVQMVGRYYGRFHAALARVNRRFHDLLNGPLYTRNLLRDPMSASCLLFAAETDRVETLQLALRYGADLNRVCDENFPEELQPIHAALAARSSRAVEFMLIHGVDVHLPSSQPPPGECGYDASRSVGWPTRKGNAVRNVMELNKIAYPLYTAVAHGTMEDVASLIDHGAYMIAKGVSALRVLDNQGWPDLVEKVSQRTDPVTLRARLHRAAAAHDMDLVRDVLKYRIHAGDLDRHRQNVLHMVIRAPKRENLPLIELLLQRPDIDATMEDNYGFTPVLAAITRRHINTVKRLMQVPRVRLTGRTAQNETALQLAIETQDPVLIEYILSQRRTLVDVLVFRSGSALSLASQMGREDNAFATIRLLLARGQPDATYKHSHPILHTLLDEPHELLIDVLKKLIVVGVDVNQVVEEPTYSRPNHFKRTLLFMAATGAQSMECMKLLVAAGAVVTDPDINSLTMLRNIFESFWDREPPSDDPDVEAYAERIRLFLELGATIGRETTEPETTALGYACEAATDESCRLLALLLDNSTAANVDESVVRALISHYESDEKREELKAKEIVRRLEAFEAKIFPK